MYGLDWAAVSQFVIDLLHKMKEFAAFITPVIPAGVAVYQWHQKHIARNLLQRVEEAAKQEKEVSIWELSDPQFPLWFTEHSGGLKLPIIVVGNLKGGVGKTVTSAYLAYCLRKYMGLRVLVIDLDYQGSLTDLLDKQGVTKSSPGAIKLLGLDDEGILVGDGVSVELNEYDKQLSLVPASEPLAALENRLQLEWLLERNNNDIRYRLARHLCSNWVERNFDAIVIDTPPRMTIGTFNAFMACSHVVIPTSLKPTSFSRVPHYIDLLKKIRDKYNTRLTVAGIALTLTNNGVGLTGPEELVKSGFLDQLRNPNNVDPSMSPKIFDQHIPRWNSLAEANFADGSVEVYRKLTEQIWEQIAGKQKAAS